MRFKSEPNHWIIVEITKEDSIDKVRIDTAKLQTVRNYLFNQNIFCNYYFVMKDKPTDAMRAAGDAQHIQVQSAEEFKNEYFEYGSYIHIRKQKCFGSLINIETGEPENNEYVNASYQNKKNGKELLN